MAADVSLKVVLEKLNDIDLKLQAVADDTSTIKLRLAELEAKVGSSQNRPCKRKANGSLVQSPADKSADGQQSHQEDDPHLDRKSSGRNCAARRDAQRSSAPGVQHKQQTSAGSTTADLRTLAQGHCTVQASATSLGTQPVSVSPGEFSLNGHETRRCQDTSEGHANLFQDIYSCAFWKQSTANRDSRQEDMDSCESRQQDIAVGNSGLSPDVHSPEITHETRQHEDISKGERFAAYDRHETTRHTEQVSDSCRQIRAADNHQNIQDSLYSVSPETAGLHEYSQDDAPSGRVHEDQGSSATSQTLRHCVAITPSSTAKETGDVPVNEEDQSDGRHRDRYSLRARRTRSDSANMNNSERLPPGEQQTSLPKRPKTVRGLANRTATETTPESVQGTGRSTTQLVEAATETGHFLGTPIASTVPGNDVVNGVPFDDFPLQVSNGNGEDFCIGLSLFDKEELLIPSQSSLQKADNERRRASSAPAPVSSSEPLALSDNQTLFRSTGSDNALTAGAGTTAPLWLLSAPSLLDALNEFDLENLNQAQSVPEDLAHVPVFGVEEKDYDNVVEVAVPTVDVFKGLLAVVRECVTTDQVGQAVTVMMGWVDKYPPVTATTRHLYETALGLGEWETFRAMLTSAMEHDSTTPTSADSRPRIILRLVMAVLERNFLFYLHHAGTKTACLMMGLLWAPSYIIIPNQRTEYLLHCLEAALQASRTPLKTCYKELLSLVSMSAQCCRLEETSTSFRPVRNGQAESSSQVFARELARLLKGCSLDVLGLLSPPWLLRQVCAKLLEDRCSDSLVPGGSTRNPWALTTIVSKYGFLLPRLSHEMESDDSCFSRPQCKFTIEKIREKDPKGETLLHKAARKKDVTLLKDILSVEGVDVNVLDNAGWTPLHEACNHGNINAVKVLLNVVPHTQANTHFQSGASSNKRRVDLYLDCNEKRFTVLHDAVWSEHIDIVKLLLRYGGSCLLKIKTFDGFTAADLAKTEEMKQALSGQNFDSQEPWPYADVLVCDKGHKLTVNYQEASTFIQLLTLLTRAHLQQTKEDTAGSAHETSDVDVQYYSQRFRRHIKAITSEEVYHQLFPLLDLFEALLRSFRPQ